MELDKFELFGGLANVRLLDRIEMGHGITLSSTFAHLMAPYMVAFAPAERGKPHPGPWKAAMGGQGFDVNAEIHVPRSFEPEAFFDRLNTIWWFVSLIRFRGSPAAIVPVMSSISFSEAAKAREEPRFWPLEVQGQLLLPKAEPDTLVRCDLDWIKRYWWSAAKLMRNGEFNLLFQACAECFFNRSTSLAMLSLWGSLEGLFSPARTELRFRISSNIAAYLEPPGPERLAVQRSVSTLYDARSQAAHGDSKFPDQAFAETYALTKRIITKIIETNRVPTREDLDAALFCGAGQTDAANPKEKEHE